VEAAADGGPPRFARIVWCDHCKKYYGHERPPGPIPEVPHCDDWTCSSYARLERRIRRRSFRRALRQELRAAGEEEPRVGIRWRPR
jgi:hypothetical protein